MDFVTLGDSVSGFCSSVFYNCLFMLLMPFFFTFTDPADFIFVTLIPVTLLCIAWQHLHRPNSEKWIRFATRVAYIFAVLGPLVPITALYLASWRASVVLGHWPQYLADDPKNICKQDMLYQCINSGVSYACAFGGWSMISFGALLLHIKKQISTTRFVWMIVAFLIAWILFVGEPGGRYAWWLD